MTFKIYEKRRSLKSYLFEKYLSYTSKTKENLSSREKTKKMVDLQAEKNKKDYKLPEMKFNTEVEENIYQNMQVFSLNNKNSKKQKVILYLHGGTFIKQPLKAHWQFMDLLAQNLDAKVIAPLYPKAPANNYKNTYPRLLNLFQDILKSTKESQQLTIMGDSAGGNIALVLAICLKRAEISQPKDIILLSPLVDMVLDNPVIFDYERRDPMLAAKGFDVIREIWSDDKDLTDPIISPLYDDLKNLGKISIFTGTHEALFPDNMKLDQKLKKQGVAHNTYVYPKMNHVFVLMPIPEAQDAHKKIMKIIKN